MSNRYKNNVKEIKNTLNSLLTNEFIPKYNLSKQNPTNTTYKQNLNQTIAAIKLNLNNLFNVSTKLQNDIHKTNKSISKLGEQINDIKSENAKLKNDLGIKDIENDTSEEMKYNYKEIYTNRYVRNWGIVLLIALLLLKKPV
jgi:peptidoglycan hydrolase CwlO-like protein